MSYRFTISLKFATRTKKFTLQTTDVVHYIVMFVDLAEQNPRRTPIRFPRSSSSSSSSSSLHPREKKRKELTDEDQKKRNRERRRKQAGEMETRERGQSVAQADVYSRHGSGYNSIT